MRYLSVFSVLLIVGCVIKPIKLTDQQIQSAYCPAFKKPMWQPTSLSASQSQALVYKQKFAVKSEDRVIWFEASGNYLGLCVVPKRSIGRGSPGCGTAYATYQKPNEVWEVEEQKLTICP